MLLTVSKLCRVCRSEMARFTTIARTTNPTTVCTPFVTFDTTEYFLSELATTPTMAIRVRTGIMTSLAGSEKVYVLTRNSRIMTIFMVSVNTFGNMFSRSSDVTKRIVIAVALTQNHTMVFFRRERSHRPMAVSSITAAVV